MPELPKHRTPTNHTGKGNRLVFSPYSVSSAALGIVLGLGLVSGAGAQQSANLEEIVVEGRRDALIGEARSASEGVVGQMDLELRPLLRPGDLLEAIPGVIVTQHSGSGKSNQMFLRGFNLDHGTDFATWIDGMPVNMRSHGHGQGYTDINFLIPETVQSLQFVKGPYHAELGDFSSAGGTHISTFARAPDNRLELGMGEDGYRRVLAMGGADVGSTHLYAALEGQVYDGPWTDIDEDVEKLNGLLRLSGNTGGNDWNLAAMHYDNQWNSADQIPERAVAAGLIDELGSLDTTLGGKSRRSSLSGSITTNAETYSNAFNAYVIDYRMRLWSNFTYFLDNPQLGDQFEQVDKRRIWGGAWRLQQAAGPEARLQHRMGIELRYDDIDEVGLHNTRQRERLSTTRQDAIEEASAGIYYELEWHFADNWRTVVGLRGDYYDFEVNSITPVNSGKEDDYIISPKGSLIYTASETTEVYFSAGSGFHSNDARGTTIRIDPASGDAVDPVDPLVESAGAEIGIKTLIAERWNSSLALWYLELDSELLFVGDAGNTEASRASERWGVEFNNFYQLNDVWSLEADLAWTDSQFKGNAPEGDKIPGAIPLVLTAGLTASDPSGWFGSLRMRYFADYPLVEDESVESDGSALANLALGWRGDNLTLQVDVLNVFDSADHDIDYWYASRLPGEPADGVEDSHYKVFEPRQVRAYVGWNF